MPTTRAWRTVLDRIERDLIEGRLHPGDHLPPERQLAADLGVGRSSVREALRVLEVLGLINTSVGSGPQAGAIIVARPGGGMSALMRLQVAASGFDVADVVETRIALETAVARSLGERHAAGDGADLADARRLLAAMDTPDLNAEAFIALDTQLHLALAEANGNQVIVATMAGLRSAVEDYVRTGSAHVASWDATADRLRAEHHGIVGAIAAGHSAAAVRRMHEHITGYFAEIGAAAAPAP